MMECELTSKTGRTPYTSPAGVYLEKKIITMKPEYWRLLYALAGEEGMTLSYYIANLGRKAQAAQLRHYQRRIEDLESICLKPSDRSGIHVATKPENVSVN